MSFSAVNMCRFVTACIFISLVSIVLAETKPGPKGEPETKTGPKNQFCKDLPEVNESRKKLRICLVNVVERHLNSSSVLKSGECQSAKDFGQALDAHLNQTAVRCNLTNRPDTTNLKKLIDFSLRNESFKKFYANIACVKNLESNISTGCVQRLLGFFNVTSEKKARPWSRMADLKYDVNTCGASKSVKDCVEEALKNCQPDSRNYVASLFKYARDLGNCTQIEIDAKNAKAEKDTASGLSPTVIVIISLGAVVTVIAIVVIIVLKTKKLR